MPIYSESAAQNIRDKLLQLLSINRPSGYYNQETGEIRKRDWSDVWNEMTGPGTELMGGGLVLKGPNAIKNISKLRKSIRDIIKIRNADIYDPYEFSRAYIKSKYPKIAGLVDRFTIETPQEYLNNPYLDPEFIRNYPDVYGYTGIMSPDDIALNIYDESAPINPIIGLVRRPNRDLSDIVETGAHELAHVVHSRRLKNLQDSEKYANITGLTGKKTFADLASFLGLSKKSPVEIKLIDTIMGRK